MTIGSASLQGIQNAESLLSATAIKVANQPASKASDEVSLSEDAVALLQAKTEIAANVNVLRVSDNLEKALLNTVG
jgi:hypothetical protein